MKYILKRRFFRQLWGILIVTLLVISISLPILGSELRKSEEKQQHNNIELTINSPDFIFGKKNTPWGSYTTITTPEETYTTTIGEAQLPVIYKMVEIPFDANPTITITRYTGKPLSLQELGLPKKIMPVQESLQKIPEAVEIFSMNEKYPSVIK